MIEGEGQSNDTKTSKDDLSIERLLQRERHVDLLTVDTATLSLTERMRQRRQQENFYSKTNSGYEESGENAPHINSFPDTCNEMVLDQLHTTNTGRTLEIAEGVDKDLSPEGRFANHMQAIQNIITGILDGRDQLLFSLLSQEISIDDISVQIQRSKKHTERLLSELRKRLETELFIPMGLNPLTAYKNDPRIKYTSLVNAAVNNRLMTVKFYGRYYTTGFAVETYKDSRRNAIPNNFNGRPISPLHASMSYSEYAHFKSSPDFSSRILIINGVACSYTSDIETFQIKNRPSSPDERPIAQLVGSETEIRRIRSAINDKRIASNKIRRVHYVTPEALQRYNESIPDHYRGRNKSETKIE